MIYNIRLLKSSLENKLHTFYQNLSEREQSKVNFSLPQFQNPSFLNAINRSIIVSNNISVNQGIKANSFVEKCSTNVVTDQNIVFDPFCTLSSKIKKDAFSNFKPPENNETKISEMVL